MVDLSIIIVTYNSSQFIRKCIDAIGLNIKDINYEIIVVDNASIDNTVELIPKHQKIKIISNKRNVGFAAANNQGVKCALGKYILILNPDIELNPSTDIAGMMKYCEEHDSVGIVAPRLLYENGEIQENARYFPSIFYFLVRGLNLDKLLKNLPLVSTKVFDCASQKKPVEVDWVIGAFMLLQKSLIKGDKLFDESYFMYYEDADLCLRLKREGYKIIYHPSASAIHFYKRDSAKKFISKLKVIHFWSFLRFFFQLKFNSKQVKN